MFDPEDSCPPEQELELNVKGICFLCLEKARQTVDDDGVWNLRNLSRFLEINLNEKVQEVIPDDGMEWNNVKVHLCHKCSQIAAKFGELYDTLEMTKLRLKGCIEQIKGVLVASGDDSDKVDEVTKAVSGRGDGAMIQLRLITSLRNEVLQKGTLKVKADPSGVKRMQDKIAAELNDLLGLDHSDDAGDVVETPISKKPSSSKAKSSSKSKDETWKATSSSSQFMKCKYCSYKIRSNGKELHLMRFHAHEFFKDHRLPHVSELMFCKIVHHILFEDVEIQEPTEGNSKRTCKCPYCPKSVPLTSNAYGLHAVRYHMVNEHVKPMSVKLKELQNDYAKTQKKVETVSGKSNAAGVICKCGCYLGSTNAITSHQQQFRCSPPKQEKPAKRKSGQLSSELIEVKPEIDVSCLVSTSLEEDSDTRKSKDEEPMEPCRFCSNMVPENPRKKELHEIRYHAHEFFKDHRLPSISEELFCKIVHHLLFDEVEMNGVDGDSESKMKEGKCPYCPRIVRANRATMSNPLQALRLHMVLTHAEPLAEKLSDLQNYPEEVQNRLEMEEKSKYYIGMICACGCYLGSRKACTNHYSGENRCTANATKIPSAAERKLMEGGGQPTATTSTSGNSKPGECVKKCRFCTNSINAERKQVELHEIKFHCHELLKADRLPNISEELFCKVVHHLLFEGVKMVGTSSKGGQVLTCPHCPKVQQATKAAGPYSMRQHIISAHRKALSSELKRLQSNVEHLKTRLNIEKKKYNYCGKTCVCGCYLATSGASSWHRKQFQCDPVQALILQPTRVSRTSRRRGKSTKAPTPEPDDPAFSRCKFCFNMINATDPGLVELHELKSHCHEYFKEDRLPHISEELFRKTVHHLLFKNIKFKTIKTGRNSKEATFSACTFCPRALQEGAPNDSSQMRLHMIKEHLAELSKQLKKIQANPKELGKSLKEAEAEPGFCGKTCICGSYMATVNAFTWHLQNFNCEQRAKRNAAEGSDSGEGVYQEYGDDDDGSMDSTYSAVQVLCKGCGKMQPLEGLHEHMSTCNGGNGMDDSEMQGQDPLGFNYQEQEEDEEMDVEEDEDDDEVQVIKQEVEWEGNPSHDFFDEDDDDDDDDSQ